MDLVQYSVNGELRQLIVDLFMVRELLLKYGLKVSSMREIGFGTLEV